MKEIDKDKIFEKEKVFKTVHSEELNNKIKYLDFDVMDLFLTFARENKLDEYEAYILDISRLGALLASRICCLKNTKCETLNFFKEISKIIKKDILIRCEEREKKEKEKK